VHCFSGGEFCKYKINSLKSCAVIDSYMDWMVFENLSNTNCPSGSEFEFILLCKEEGQVAVAVAVAIGIWSRKCVLFFQEISFLFSIRFFIQN